MLTFREELWLKLVDKALIGGLIAIAGYWLNKYLEKYKSERALENELAKLRDQKRIELFENQLSQFFWPVYLRLQMDNVVWERILDRGNKDEAKRNLARQIETGFILPNHQEVVGVIQRNIHLAGSAPALFEAILQYLRHVAVYSALRATGDLDTDPIDVGAPWPREFFPALEAATKSKQREFDALLARRTSDTVL